MRFWPALLALAVDAAVRAQPPPDPSLFQLGVWADEGRATSCVEGPVGTDFVMAAFAWVPDDLGLAYVTFRFAFPAGLDLSGPRTLHPDVRDVIITDFPGGTQEWNFLMIGCRSGWVWVFTQECTIFDDAPARIGIQAGDCWLRDCGFVLNEVGLLSEILINEPGCGDVPVVPAAWGAVKVLFR